MGGADDLNVVALDPAGRMPLTEWLGIFRRDICDVVVVDDFKTDAGILDVYLGESYEL